MLTYITATIISILLMKVIYVNDTDIVLKKDQIQLKHFKNRYFLPFLPLFLVSFFREGIGVDYNYIYVPIFNRISNNLEVDVEYGYYLINKLVIALNGDVFWVFAIMTLIFFVFTSLFILEQSSSYTTSILFLFLTGFYTFSFCIIRQAAAIAMVLYAHKYIKKNNFFRYLIIVLLASTLHKSALIFIPLYFFLKKRFSITTIIIMLLSSVLAFPILPYLIRFISKTFYGARYFGSKYDNNNFMLLYFIINIIVMVVCLLYHRKLLEHDSNNAIIINYHILNTVFMMYSYFIITPNRIYIMFIPIIMILIPEILKVEKNAKIRFLFLFLMILLFSFCMFSDLYINEDGYGIRYYKSIFSNI